jgi:predicted small metal-binding protein
MARTFACREIGIECQWLITAETEDRLLSKIQGHVAEIHRDLDMTPEFTAKIEGAFRD